MTTAPLEGIFRRDRFEALKAGVESRRSIAETLFDTQATRTDDEQRAWLAGYIEACKDTTDHADLIRQTTPKETTECH